jgi:hypothetical protein
MGVRFSRTLPGVELTKDDIAKRLFANYQEEPDTGCWVWTGQWLKKGQGVMYLPVRRAIYVHKAAAFVWLDVPLHGSHKVVHKKGCNGPACFNPEHLLVFQTNQEIVEAQKAGLVRGQIIGEARHGTKMTLAKALQIKAALLAAYNAKRRGAEPELFVDIAERLDVTINQVRAIHSRRAWKYIWEKGFKCQAS